MEQVANTGIGLHTLVLAVGVLQGLVLGISLTLHGRRRNRAEIFLGLALVAYSLMLVDDVLFESRLLLRFPDLANLFSLFIFLPAPLFYLYVRTMTNPDRRVGRADLWHMLPFLLLVIATVPAHMESPDEKLAEIQQIYQAGEFYFNFTVVVPIIQLFAYFGAIAWLLVRHARRIRSDFSSLAPVSLHWIWWLLAGYLAVALMWLVSYWFRWSFGLKVLDLAFAVGVYAFGYLGWRQPAIPAATSDTPLDTENQTQKPKYAKSALTVEQMESIQQRLLTHMNEHQPFLDPELSLASLAAQLDILPHNLSRVINENLNMTFFDLVNSYRVKEAQRLLSSPDRREMKVLAVAFESGFQSKSAFNAAFRHHIGMTPSSFRNQLASSGHPNQPASPAE